MPRASASRTTRIFERDALARARRARGDRRRPRHGRVRARRRRGAGCCATIVAAASWRGFVDDAYLWTGADAHARVPRVAPAAPTARVAACRCRAPVAARYTRAGLALSRRPDHRGTADAPARWRRRCGRAARCRPRWRAVGRVRRRGCTRAACTTPTSMRTTCCSARRRACTCSTSTAAASARAAPGSRRCSRGCSVRCAR